MEKVIAPTADVSIAPDKAIEDQTEALITEEAQPSLPMEKAVSTEEEAATEDQPKGSKAFSPEERATIIAIAKEVGFAKVAREFGIKARLISYWVQQEKKKASKSLKPRKQTAAKGKSSSPTLGIAKEAAQSEGALTEPFTPTIATEPVKAVKPAKPAGRRAERTVSDEPLERSEGKQALTDRKTMTDEQSLIVENAILKERVSALKAEIEKLRAALTSLM